MWMTSSCQKDLLTSIDTVYIWVTKTIFVEENNSMYFRFIYYGLIISCTYYAFVLLFVVITGATNQYDSRHRTIRFSCSVCYVHPTIASRLHRSSLFFCFVLLRVFCYSTESNVFLSCFYLFCQIDIVIIILFCKH